MARKRASMHEGPLAELFRATEAAQRQAEREPAAYEEERAPRDSETQPDAVAARAEPLEETVPHVPEWDAPPPQVRQAAPAEEPPAARWIEPLPEPPPRLQRVPRGDAGTYLAVIRVVGVGGAGLNAVDRMIDAGISQVE